MKSPPSISTMRVTMRFMNSRSCEVRSRAPSYALRKFSSQMSDSRSRWFEGSSSSIASGRMSRMRARATRIFQPPDSCPTSPSIISCEKPRPARISRARASSAYPPSSPKRDCTSPNRSRIPSSSSARAGSAMASSSSLSSAAMMDTCPAPAITAATVGCPRISPTSWLK